MYATKAYRGHTSIIPPTLNLGTRLRWVASFTPRLLYPSGKNHQYLLNRKLGGSHSQSGCFWKQAVPCPCRQSNLRLSSSQHSHCTGWIIPAPKLCGVISHKTVTLKQHYVLSGSVKPSPVITEWWAYMCTCTHACTSPPPHTHTSLVLEQKALQSSLTGL